MADEELELHQEPEEMPEIFVNVNAGFGRKSYYCRIDGRGMMTLPNGLVRELGMEIGDDLEWRFDETDGTIYISLVRNPWKPPEWLEE